MKLSFVWTGSYLTSNQMVTEIKDVCSGLEASKPARKLVEQELVDNTECYKLLILMLWIKINQEE